MKHRQMLQGPDELDTAKLHAEVNQLVNQRFTLSTTAVGVAGLAAGWMVTADFKSEWEVFAANIAALGTLALLLHQARLARKMIRRIAKYLAFTGRSKWEADWRLLSARRQFRAPYSKPQNVLFFWLGFGSTWLGLLGMWWRGLVSLSGEVSCPFWLVVTAWGLYCAFVICDGYEKASSDIDSAFTEFTRASEPPLHETSWLLCGALDNGVVTLNWNAIHVENVNHISVRVFEGQRFGVQRERALAELGPDETSWTDATLFPGGGIVRVFRVYAVSEDGQQSPSNSLRLASM